MRDKILGLLRFAYESFGPLVVFLAVKAASDLKTAIAAAVAFGVLDLVVRLVRKRAISRLYVFSFVITVAFGAVDLYAETPFLFAYEASITNLLTAGFFGATLVRGTPLIEEMAEKGLSADLAARADVRAYLRVLTVAWTGYFVLKAALYAYLGATLSIERAIALRSVIGTASLITMILGEMIVRRPLFRLLQRLGVLPAPAAPPVTAPAGTPDDPR